MKNKFLKFFVLLTFVMLIFIIPNVADAATYGIYTYTTSGDKVTIADCDTYASGAIVIPSEINGKKVTSIGDYAFSDCTSLTSITIPDSVTSIGSSAFRYCESLTSITIPDSVTSIGSHAFSGCKSLTSIIIPDSVTSIGSWAFYGTALYNDSSNWDNGILYIDNHLIKCDTSYSGECVIKPGTLTIAGYAFSGCRSLTSITIPDSVTSIGGYAFSGCTSLSSITIPDSVTSIGSHAFSGCNNLKDVYISDIDAWCGIYFSDSSSNPLYNGAKLYLDGNLLTEVELSDSTTKIGSYAFYNCTSLTSITIPDSVTSIGDDAFWRCNNLKDVYISDIDAWCGIEFEDYEANPLCNGAKLYLNGNLLTEVVLPESVTSIGGYAFYNCTSLTSITIPDSVTSIGYYAFYGCTSLTSITIPESVTSIGYDAFSGCTKLNGVYITDIDAWCGIYFSNSSSNPLCYGANLYLDGNLLTEVVLPESVTSIGHGAFYNCTSLTTITIPDSVTRIGNYAFYGCESLESVYFTGNANTWNDLKKSVGSGNEKLLNAEIFYVKIPCVFLNADGSVFEKIMYEKGSTIVLPDKTPTKTATAQYSYTFAGWEGYVDGMTITGDVTFTPIFTETINKYTYRFENEDGTLISSGTEDYGFKIVVPSTTPTKASTAQYTYTFAGWSGYTSGMTITGDVTFTPIFTEAINKYTYRFENEDGTLISSGTEDYGFKIVVPSTTPTKASTAQYTYTFAGWSGYASGMTLTGNVTFKAAYTKTKNKYTYRFEDEDGTLISSGTKNYGFEIVPPASPNKASTAQYTYTFAGWNGYTEGMTLIGNVTFKATYTSTVNKYTYRFENEDGTLISSGTEDYGFEIVPPVSPNKASTAQYTYTFANWSGYTSGMTLTGDVTFRATYAAVVNQYTYTFLNADGNKFYSKTADYGMEINLPSESPFKAEQYLFTGWKGYSSGMILTEDVTFEPQYTLKSYNIIVEGFSSPISVVYGNNFHISPAKKEPYTFAGYYTEPGGKGTKLTDSDGDSISGFNFVSDICAYPYFEDMDKNIVGVDSEYTGAEPGDTNVAFNVKIAISDDVQNAIMYVKYPSSMELKNVTSPFDYVELQSETKDGEFTIAEIAFIYSFDGDSIPTLKYMNILKLYFDISKSALPGTSTVEITNDSVLMGEEDFSFDVIEGKTLQINPKLAESISIVGNTQILEPTKYEAVVYPDYTTDKSVIWSVDDETIATITNDGYLIPVKSGTVIVTAKSVSNPSVYATKTVYITKKADISSVTSDIGYWIDSFESSDYDYEIVADSNVTEITFTPTFTGGMLKINGSTVFSGRTKTIPLTDDVTTITFERTNVANCADSVYTITVVKSDESMITEKISENKINITFNKPKILPFEKAVLLAALYDETGNLIDIVPAEVAKEDKYAEIEIAQLNNCAECKLMLWDAFSILKPVCEYETVERN